MIRKIFILISFFVSLCCEAKNFSGRIIDSTTGLCVPYATITICDSIVTSKPVIADKNGFFKIEVGDNISGLKLKISSIGYETLTCSYSEENGSIRIFPKQDMLAGVTVSARRNVIRQIDDGIEVKIKGNTLSDISTTNEMIRQLPFVDAVSEGINVLGSNKTVVYINSHKVVDLNEIKELTPKQIENVQIIMNPGLKYGRDVDAVLIIKTIRKNQGVAGFASGNYGIQRKVSSYGSDNQLTWTDKNGLTFLTGVSYSDDASKGDLSTSEAVPEIYVAESEGIEKIKNKKLSAVVASFVENDKSSYGVRYRFSRTPSNTINNDFVYSSLFSNGNKHNSTSQSISKNDDYRHWVNMYYNHDFSSNWTMSSDINGYVGKKNTFYNDKVTDGELNDVVQASGYNMDYKLIDGRADVNYSNKKVDLNFGAQYTFTSTKQFFDGNNTILKEQTFNNQNQSLYALYASLKINLCSRWRVLLGLRNEIEILNYKKNGKKNDSSSGVQNNFTPHLSFTYRKGALRATLAYKYNLYRPAYYFLSDNVTFITPTLYLRGNPLLEKNKEHEFELSLYWKKSYLYFNYGIGFNRNDNAVKWDETQHLAFMTPSSISRMRSLAILAQQRFDVDFWHPTFTAILLMQNTKFGNPQKTYNKPYFRLQWKNQLNLPYKIRLYPTFYYESFGNTNLYRMHQRCITSVSINRLFGNLSIDLSAKDIFNSWKNEYNINTNNMNYGVSKKYGTTISIDITYNFNTAKKKYKGSSNSSEINRL